MNDAEETFGVLTFVDSLSKKETAVIGLFSDEEFSWAQVVVPDLVGYFSYGDWLDSREGFQIGLAIAGVDVTIVSVALAPFLAWCRLTGAPPSERALDAFASMILVLKNPPEPRVLAVVRQAEFDSYSGKVAAFRIHHDFGQWLLHRETIREGLAASHPRIEELPIRIKDFVAWSQCLGESTSEAAMDQYAKLVLEYLTYSH